MNEGQTPKLSTPITFEQCDRCASNDGRWNRRQREKDNKSLDSGYYEMLDKESVV